MKLYATLAGALGMVIALAVGVGAEAQAPAATPQTSPDTRPAEKPKRSLRQLIGFDAAKKRLGDRMPTGRGIVFGHVEGGGDGYLPRVDAPWARGVNFIPQSPGRETSGHANGTARIIYGKRGLAPGVQSVRCYSAGDWLRAFLRPGSPDPVEETPVRVFNHSWIAPQDAAAVAVLRRVDHLIDTQGVVMCVGVNNGRNSLVPALLGSGHNVIAVGTASGNGANSGGFTRVEVEGRSKPDIVGPRGLTSFATPVVSATAGLLLDAAGDVDHPMADRPETVKAILLDGALKTQLWRQPPGKPLDEHLGAGVVNADQALTILLNGPSGPGEIAPRSGWDARPINPAGRAVYRFTLDEPTGPVSVALTWHRKVAGNTIDVKDHGKVWNNAYALADLDLRLIQETTGGDRVAAISDSEIDNVEHIYFDELPAGTYRLEVWRQPDAQPIPWPYALAWRFGGPQYFDPE